MTAMMLALLLTLQNPSLVDIRNLTPRDHRVSVFVLDAPQALRVTAVGGEPRPDGFKNRDPEQWQDDAVTMWPAAGWILDARTRAVVWDLRAAETTRESNGLRRFAGTLQLPAGVYEAHYASYPSAVVSMDERFSVRGLARRSRGARHGGPYVDDGLYKEFAFSIIGAGRLATAEEIVAARGAFTAPAIATATPGRNAVARQGFELTRPTAIDIYAIGEMFDEDETDYGWIMNAATRERVWAMTHATSEPAGGALKNRMVQERLVLKPGRYVAYFVSDDSHHPGDWNTVPATDPEFWGLTLRVSDPGARAAVRPFVYEPVPVGHTLASLIGIGDRATRSSGFTLRRAMDVRIYAIGEGDDDTMVDYAWIVDATRHARVWTMRYEETAPAGGSAKNRLFEGTIRLEAGSYLVHYTSDDSHSYNDWNGSPPMEERFWGVSVFPASGRLNPADVGPFEPGPGGEPVAQLMRMGNNAEASVPFRLARATRLRVYALGEGIDGQMYDHGWIEDGAGRIVWEMTYDATDPAGGARKNRLFDGIVTLPAGAYVLRYKSDGTHANGSWNDDPPSDPENWGVSVFRMEDR